MSNDPRKLMVVLEELGQSQAGWELSLAETGAQTQRSTQVAVETVAQLGAEVVHATHAVDALRAEVARAQSASAAAHGVADAAVGRAEAAQRAARAAESAAQNAVHRCQAALDQAESEVRRWETELRAAEHAFKAAEAALSQAEQILADAQAELHACGQATYVDANGQRRGRDCSGYARAVGHAARERDSAFGQWATAKQRCDAAVKALAKARDDRSLCASALTHAQGLVMRALSVSARAQGAERRAALALEGARAALAHAAGAASGLARLDMRSAAARAAHADAVAAAGEGAELASRAARAITQHHELALRGQTELRTVVEELIVIDSAENLGES